jgi:hypothetical protein
MKIINNPPPGSFESIENLTKRAEVAERKVRELQDALAEKDKLLSEAVEDMSIIGNADKYDYVGGCYVCKHNEKNYDDYSHSGCDYEYCRFAWRGGAE